MRLLAFLALWFVWCGWADEASDRAAIRQTLRNLTVEHERDAQFTSDADGKAAVEAVVGSSQHEVLGCDYWPCWPFPAGVNVERIRFVTPDVALVDARLSGRLLFVMKKDEGKWKIASVRVLRW